MHVSATSLTPDWPVCKVTPSDNTERTARSSAVVETIFLSRLQRAQCRRLVAEVPLFCEPHRQTLLPTQMCSAEPVKYRRGTITCSKYDTPNLYQ